MYGYNIYDLYSLLLEGYFCFLMWIGWKVFVIFNYYLLCGFWFACIWLYVLLFYFLIILNYELSCLFMV